MRPLPDIFSMGTISWGVNQDKGLVNVYEHKISFFKLKAMETMDERRKTKDLDSNRENIDKGIWSDYTKYRRTQKISKRK